MDCIRSNVAFIPVKAAGPGPRAREIRDRKPRPPKANPRESWPAWTQERWTIETEDGPAPSWDAPRHEPESIEAAWWAGFRLGQDGEYPAAPKTMTERDRYFFNCGRLAGFIESPEGRAWQEDMRTLRDRAFADPADAIHPNEACGVC